MVVVNVVKMTGLWFCKSGENDGIYCFGRCCENDWFSGCGQYGKTDGYADPPAIENRDISHFRPLAICKTKFVVNQWHPLNYLVFSLTCRRHYM